MQPASGSATLAETRDELDNAGAWPGLSLRHTNDLEPEPFDVLLEFEPARARRGMPGRKQPGRIAPNEGRLA